MKTTSKPSTYVRITAALVTAASWLVLVPVAQAHGRLTQPPSRIVLCTQGLNPTCPVASWKANAMENGKFFPATQAGVQDAYAPEDAPNGIPPKDGEIAGASNNGAEPVLNQQGTSRWKHIPLIAGSQYTFRWDYSAVHATRRWNYFITRAGWNPNAPLTRAQFDPQPFCSIQNDARPYWSADLRPANPTLHSCKLPDRTGYHVILAVWEVADTPNAFYQVVDADFIQPGSLSTRRPF
ncbi:lytic polysaccharide monooxygenase auxiliary activity family 9 protein [Paraburkholderia aspalathi]|uniref:lytic polysaccharide monooxygenase auxiliary activity family 9 protein n=1 Tax=Paraburkholderia aspalathi TaxID=1324617 RepID=UPI0038BD9871